MSGRKWKTEELSAGMTGEATFWPNPVPDSEFALRATHFDGRRAPKVVLTRDPRVVAGSPCLVRIVSITKPDRDDRGAIVVEWIGAAPFRLESVWLDPVVSKKLQVLLQSGLNILLDGPQGCGKTVLARAIAQSLGLEFVFFNCGAVIDASDFFATIQVRASSSGAPVTDFVKTEVLEAIERANNEPESRFLVFLDELNRCQQSARNALMPALDATRKVFHPIENRFIQIPDNVQFIAAINRGREFTATFAIDAAQLDRFAPLQMDYLPPEEEVKLLAGRHPEVPQSVVEHVVAVADAVRRSADLPGTLSVRATEEACVYLKHPLFAGDPKTSVPEVLRTSFCGRFAGRPLEPDTDAGAVWGVIAAKLRELSYRVE